MGGEAEGNAAQHLHQHRDQRWVVGEVRMHVVDRPPRAALTRQQPRQVDRLQKALVARRGGVAFVEICPPHDITQCSEIAQWPARRSANMLAQNGQAAALARIFKIFHRRADSGHLRLHDRLARVGDREQVQVLPDLLQCQNLVQDKRLRQARVAAQDVADALHNYDFQVLSF